MDAEFLIWCAKMGFTGYDIQSKYWPVWQAGTTSIRAAAQAVLDCLDAPDSAVGRLRLARHVAELRTALRPGPATPGDA